jgi:hypothetical protein
VDVRHRDVVEILDIEVEGDPPLMERWRIDISTRPKGEINGDTYISSYREKNGRS